MVIRVIRQVINSHGSVAQDCCLESVFSIIQTILKAFSRLTAREIQSRRGSSLTRPRCSPVCSHPIGQTKAHFWAGPGVYGAGVYMHSRTVH